MKKKSRKKSRPAKEREGVKTKKNGGCEVADGK